MLIQLKLNTENLNKKLSYALALRVKAKKCKRLYTLEAHCYILFMFKTTLNNVHFILSNVEGMPFYNLSAGKLRYRNSQKTTPLATRVLSIRIVELLSKLGKGFIHLRLRGFGQRLRIFLRELNVLTKKKRNQKIKTYQITWVEKNTVIPLNGCKNSRRVI